jgi:hypothetical protein
MREGHPLAGKKGHLHSPARVKSPYLLSGLAVCAHCGSAMVANKSGDGWRGYVCGKKQRKGFKSCQGRLVGKAKADRVILDQVLSRILTVEYFKALLNETRAQFADTSEAELQLATFKKSLTQTDREIDNLLDLAATFGALSAGKKIVELENTQARLKHQIMQLEAQIESAHIEISSEAMALVVDMWHQQINDAQEKQDIRALRYILKRFVCKIELDYNQANVWYNYPLDSPITLKHPNTGWGHFLFKCREPITIEWS